MRTPVPVTKPIRGSFSSPIPSESTSFTASLTRRMRSLIERHELARARPELPFLAVQVPLRLVEESLRLAGLAGDARDGQARALPQLVVVDLRHRRAETVLELGLRRADELALALQRAGLGEVQVDRHDPHVARAHDNPFCRGQPRRRVYAGVGAGFSERSVRSTCRVSKTSKTSPSRRSLKPSRRMPHSKPSDTSRTSSLKRRSCAIDVSWMTVPSRTIRARAPRRTTPRVT